MLICATTSAFTWSVWLTERLGISGWSEYQVTWGTGGSVLKGWCGLHIKHDWWILAAEKTAKGKLDEVWDTRTYVLNLHTSQLLGHECILGCDRVCTLQIHYNQFLPSGCFLFVATDFLMQFMPSPQFQNRGFSRVNHYTVEPQTHT